MKKQLLLTIGFFCLLVLSPIVKAQTSITIEEISYPISIVETLPVTPDVTYTRYDIPDFPLKFSVLRIDRRAQDLKIEAWSGLDYTFAGKEHPQDVSVRKTTNDFEVIAAINGDFFGSFPCAAEMVQGELSQRVLSPEFCVDGDDCSPHIAFDADNKPLIDVMRFNPYVAHLDGKKYDVNSVNNSWRGENFLNIYNAYYESEQTTTNEWGVEYLVAPVGGRWLPDENGNITCVIEKIRAIGDVNKLDIEKGKAVLSGHGEARTFLEEAGLGDEIYVNWGAYLDDNPGISNFTNLVGGNTICLKNSVAQPYGPTDGDREKMRHPRTAVGYSNDGNYVYFYVVDGRQTGMAGVTTRELADICKFAGADIALNLDGGGSSSMVVNGVIKNSAFERRDVVNGLLVAKTSGSSDIKIVAKDTTADAITVIRTESGLQAQFTGTATIMLYDLRGCLLDKTKATDSYSRVLHRGIYIIQVNGKAIKVVL